MVQMQQLLLNSCVDERKSTVLCCKKHESHRYSNDRAAESLDALGQDEEDLCYFAVDRQGHDGVSIHTTQENGHHAEQACAL